MKIIKRIIAGSSLAVVLSFVALVAFLLYPNNLFAKRRSYREFTIYSNHTLIGNYAAVFDHARTLARASALYDASYTYDVILADGSYYKTVEQAVLERAMARSLDNNIILNVAVDFDNNRLYSKTNWRNLTQTIAHEMVHCLQLNTYGVGTFNPVTHPPYWKLEGYPEYIALQEVLQDSDYNFAETVEALNHYVTNNVIWIEHEAGRTDNIIYFKGRVMIEYLMDIKGMTYDQILQDPRHEDEIYQELLTWHNQTHGKE